MTESNSHIRYLDGWRGIAILLVLLEHFGSPAFASDGLLGVTLFFVLSGYFIGNLLFVKKIDLSTFFIRRVSRILPALWIYLACMYIFANYIQASRYHLPYDELASNFLFLGTYFPLNRSIWALYWPNSHLWSLNIEEHAYLFLGVVAALTRKTARSINAEILLIGSVIAIVAINVMYMRHLLTGYGISPWRTRTESAGLGIVAAAAYGLFLRQRNWLGDSPAVPVAALLITAAGFFPVYHVNYAILISPLAAAVAVNHARHLPITIRKILSAKLICWFGNCSFSIYLWQHPFYYLVKKEAFSPLAGVALGVMSGALSFYIVENPARKYVNRVWQRRTERRAGLPAASG